MPTPPILSSLIPGNNSNGKESSTQYFVMMGWTLVSMNVRTCFTTASSSAGKVFYQLLETLPPGELAVGKQVRTFMETKVQPIITKYWVEDSFPFELLPTIKELNIGGVGMTGYGCRGGSGQLFGLIAMEMARVDTSIATFFGVHNGLAMGSIYITGSEEQKQKWLPPMARFEMIGCFGLTEPEVGSGAAGGLLTTAKRDGDTWILN